MVKKRKKKINTKDFMLWSLSFTKKLIIVVTAMWAFCLFYSAIMIFYAVLKVDDFSYLDTFIADNGETFRLIVGANLISKTIENVFKYNNGGLFGTSISESHGSPVDNPEGDIER